MSLEQINIEAFEQSKGVYYTELPAGTYEIDVKKRVIVGYNEKVIIDLDNKPKEGELHE